VTYRGVVSDEQHEPNRVLGFPVGRRPAPGPRPPDPPAGKGSRAGEEAQRVLGFPVDWFRQVNLGRLRALARVAAGKGR
jgi:hypothetical protein